MLPNGTVRILSIDGGGIRGIIPALLLARLRDRLREKGQDKHYAQIFDLIAGTSTGGIVALGLSAPADRPKASSRSGPGSLEQKEGASLPFLPLFGRGRRQPRVDIEDLAQVYRHRGEEIFPRQGLSRIRDVKQAFRQKYSAETLENLSYELFGDSQLKDTLCPVLVTAYNATLMKTQLFRTSRAKLRGEENFYLKDILRATTAAPSYFEPALVSPLGRKGRGHILVDGGLYANNPSLYAYQEARRIYPFARRFQIISIGTGRQIRAYSYEQMKSWGFIDWFNPLRGVPFYMMMIDGQNETAASMLNGIKKVEYIRLDEDLKGCGDGIDDASPRNIECLEAVVDSILEDQKSTIDRALSVMLKA